MTADDRSTGGTAGLVAASAAAVTVAVVAPTWAVLGVIIGAVAVLAVIDRAEKRRPQPTPAVSQSAHYKVVRLYDQDADDEPVQSAA